MASAQRLQSDSDGKRKAGAQQYLVCHRVPDYAVSCVKDLVLSHIPEIKVCVTGDVRHDVSSKASLEQLCDSSIPKYWNEAVSLVCQDILEAHRPGCDCNDTPEHCKLSSGFPWPFDGFVPGSRACVWYWARVEEAMVRSSLLNPCAEFPGHEWKGLLPSSDRVHASGFDSRVFGPLRGKFLTLKLLSAEDGTNGFQSSWVRYIIRQDPKTLDGKLSDPKPVPVYGPERKGRLRKTIDRFRRGRALFNSFPPITHVVGTMVMNPSFNDDAAWRAYGGFPSCKVSIRKDERDWTFESINGVTVLLLACCVLGSPAADKLLAMPRTGRQIIADFMKQENNIRYVGGMCEVSPEAALTQIVHQAVKPDPGIFHGQSVSIREWTRLCFAHVTWRFAERFTDITSWDGVSEFDTWTAIPRMLYPVWAAMAYSKDKLYLVRQAGLLVGCAWAAFVTQFLDRSSSNARQYQERKLWAALVVGLVKAPTAKFSGLELPTDEGLAIFSSHLDQRLSKKDAAVQQALTRSFDWMGTHLRSLLARYTADHISHEDFTRHFEQAYRYCIGADLQNASNVNDQSFFGGEPVKLSDPLDPRYTNEKAHYEFAFNLFCPPFDESGSRKRSTREAKVLNQHR